MLPAQLAVLLTVTFFAALLVGGRLDFLAAEFPMRRQRVLALLLLAAVLTSAVFYPAVSPSDAAHFDPDLLVFPFLFVGHVLLALFLVSWWVLGRNQPFGRFLRVHDRRWSDLWFGLQLGAVGWVATIVGTGLVAIPLGANAVLPETPQLPPLMVWLAGLSVPRKLLVIAAAMTAEEAFFRAFLQTRIGWIPSSVLFALAHASYGLPLMMVSVLVISLFIGWGLRQTGRLLPCIVAHGVFDGIQLLVVIPVAVRMLEKM
jgi:membrane protease YdiL (CAAX protease family)